MDIDGIKTLVAISRFGGFTRAATHLNRSQPAISRRIGLMEAELGAPLIERVRGGVKLTDAGMAFLPFAEAALAAVEDGLNAVRASTGVDSGFVSVALVGTLADTHIVDILRRFARRFKTVDLDLRTATSQEVSDLVRRGEVTLGLRYVGDGDGDLMSEIIGGEAMLVIATPDHPLAGKRATPEALRGERWIGFPAGGGRQSFGQILQRQLAASGLDQVRLTIIDSLTAQKRLVEAGFGIALMPESSIRDELRIGTLRELDAPALRTTVKIALLHRRDGYLNPAACALMASIKEGPPRIRGRRNRTRNT